MLKNKKLTLNKETLTDLELQQVTGGIALGGIILTGDKKPLPIGGPIIINTRKGCTFYCTEKTYTTPDGPGGCM